MEEKTCGYVGQREFWAEGTAFPSQALDLGECLVCSRKQKEAVLAGLKSREETIRENSREARRTDGIGLCMPL